MPAYGDGAARRPRGPVIGVTVALVLAVAVCGVIGAAGFLFLGDHSSDSASEPVAVAPSQAPAGAPNQAPTDAPGQAVPTEFPTDLPSLFPLPTAADGKPHDIVYEVTGEADTASVTYLGFDEVVAGAQQVNLPWHKEVTNHIGTFAVTLMAVSPSGETVSCRISVDGHQVDAVTGDGMVVCVGLVR